MLVRRPLLIISIIALGFVAYFWMNSARSQTVMISDEGFSPNVISVRAGTKVIFQNIGGMEHWPASDFHPTHTVYPERGGCLGSMLDACRGLQKGETYEFVFRLPGRFAMHDHLFPGHAMIINVSDDGRIGGSFSSASSLPEPAVFRALPHADQIQMMQAFSQADPDETWNFVKETFLVGGQVLEQAHEFAHMIGNSLYEKHGFDGIVRCDQSFAFGCYHGITEKALSAKGVEGLRQIEGACVSLFPPSKSQKYASCIHGTGHGLLTLRNFDIYEALSDCDILSQSYRSFCYDGVFMENASAGVNANADSWVLCQSFGESYQASCSRYQAFLSLEKNGFEEAVQMCAAAPAPMQEPCFEGVGAAAAQQTFGEAKEILSLCALAADQRGEKICIIAAARENIFQAYKNWQTSSKALCDALSGDWNRQCLLSNASTMSTYAK